MNGILHKLREVEITKDRLIIIISCAVAIIVFVLYLFLYGPLISKSRLAYSQCKGIETELMQAQASIASLKTTVAKKGLITEEGVSSAMDELTREGKLRGINFISLTPKQIEKQPGPYKILPVEMEIESPYEALGIFLGALDDLEKNLIKVEKFSVVPSTGNPARLKMELTINMYLIDKENAE